MGLEAGIWNLGLGSEIGTEYWRLRFGNGNGDLELGAGTGAGISKWGLVLGIWIRGIWGRALQLSDRHDH